LSGRRCIGLYLQIIEIQFVPAGERGVAAGTGGAGGVVFDDGKLIAAVAAKAALRTDAGVELEGFPLGALHYRFEAKGERIHIDGGEFANAQADADGARAGMAGKLLADRCQDRFRDGELMHAALPGRFR